MPSFALFHKFFLKSWSDGIFDNHRRLGSATGEFLSYFRNCEHLLAWAAKMVCHSKRQVVLRNEIFELDLLSLHSLKKCSSHELWCSEMSAAGCISL